jgi:separase
MQFAVKTDLVARAVDSLCVLARTMPSQSTLDTPTAVYDCLQRGVTIVKTHETTLSSSDADNASVDVLTNVIRCISVAFWNHAIALYQHEKYGHAVRFLVEACELGTRVCSMVRDIDRSANDPGSASSSDSWTTFKVGLPKRWELLGDCYMRIGDRQAGSTSYLQILSSDGLNIQLAYSALIESIKAHSFERFCHLASSLSPAQISSDAAYSRLFSLVQRTTHVAVSDLFFTETASLCHPLSTLTKAPEVIGVLLEWQVTGLEESLWNSERRPVVNYLLQDALRMYDAQFPIRRARYVCVYLN